MRYLVTGGAGFLGTNLCLSLMDSGDDVVALDDLSTAFLPNLRLLEANDRFDFIRHDVTEPFPEMGGFDFIYNLACPASPARYCKDPVKTFRTSVWGAWNALQYASKDGTPLFHSSTSEVYGDPHVHPQPEGYWGNVNPIGPRSCYDEGKRAAESLLFDFHMARKHPIMVARIFNTYGPHMDPDDGRVVSSFIVNALRGRPIPIHGDGRQTRSFCYVDDMIDAFRRMERSRMAGPVNLGNEEENSILDLATALEEAMGKPLRRQLIGLPADDPKKRKPDAALARERLGWAAKTSLSEGLARTVAYFSGLGIGPGQGGRKVGKKPGHGSVGI
jgi:UDP-glucuronate decarboxylase